MVLGRNPENCFAEVEQAAFSPGSFVPGIAASPDKMLQGRLFSYPDTHGSSSPPRSLNPRFVSWERPRFSCPPDTTAGGREELATSRGAFSTSRGATCEFAQAHPHPRVMRPQRPPLACRPSPPLLCEGVREPRSPLHPGDRRRSRPARSSGTTRRPHVLTPCDRYVDLCASGGDVPGVSVNPFSPSSRETD